MKVHSRQCFLNRDKKVLAQCTELFLYLFVSISPTFGVTSEKQQITILHHPDKKPQGNTCLSLMNNSFQDSFDRGTSCFRASCLLSDRFGEWFSGCFRRMFSGCEHRLLQALLQPLTAFYSLFRLVLFLS